MLTREKQDGKEKSSTKGMNNSNKRKIVIFDIDGTLANTRHRQELLTREYKNSDEKWKAFHEASMEDQAIPQVSTLFYILSRYMRVVFFTGRSEEYRDLTEEWLKKNVCIPWDVDAKFGGENFHRFEHQDFTTIPVYMRKASDKREDLVVKEEMLDALIQDAGEDFEIFGVFDDRKSVCDMWNRRGVFCFDVAQGRGDF